MMRLGAKGLPVILLSLFLVACAGTQTIPQPESPGARLYQERCTRCHGLPSPKRHTSEQWGYLLVMMEGFMLDKNVDFPAQEKELIRDYLYRNAK